jgi:hypothetical protein
MKRWITTAIIVGIFGFSTLAFPAQAQTPHQSADGQAALLKQLTAELQQLRMEVIQQAIEFQNWKIKQLERELLPIRNERQRLGEQEQAIRQLTAEIDAQAGGASSVPEGGISEQQTIKAVYPEKELKDLSTKQQLITEREAELTQQLEQEQNRLQEFIKKTRK